MQLNMSRKIEKDPKFLLSNFPSKVRSRITFLLSIYWEFQSEMVRNKKEGVLIHTGSFISNCNFRQHYYMVFEQSSGEKLGRFLKLRHETIISTIVKFKRMPHFVRIWNLPKIHFFHNLDFMKIKNLIFLFSCHRRLQILASCKIQVYQTW